MGRTGIILVAGLLGFGCVRHDGAIGASPEHEPSATQSQAIHGTVMGHDGKPLRVAHVRVLGLPDDAVLETEVDVAGTFSIEVPHTGLAQLEVTAVDHAAHRLVVVLDRNPFEAKIQLGTHPRDEPLQELAAFVWEGDPDNSAPTVVPLARRKDNTWAAELETKAKTVRYQVGGIADAGRIVNGPIADRYEFDHGGDYRSVVAVEGGKLRIEIDPAKLVRPDAAPVVEFGEPNGPSARLQRLRDAVAPHEVEVRNAIAALGQVDPATAAAISAKHDWSEPRATALEVLETDTNPAVRRFTIGEYFQLGGFDPDNATAHDRKLATELLGDMPADDQGWQLFTRGMVMAVSLSSDPKHRERFDVLLDEELPAPLAAELLWVHFLEASTAGDVVEARALYKRLQRPERFGDSPMLEFAKPLDPDGPMAPGKTLPAFEIATGKGSRKVSHRDLRGKVVLIDLWATWCPPCIAEMPNLHAAHEKFAKAKVKRRRFEILSIAVEDETEQVAAFRAGEFAMPWKHGRASFEDIGAAFGVSGLPFAVLVDERGTIVASGPAVTGARLHPLLADVLSKPAPR